VATWALGSALAGSHLTEMTPVSVPRRDEPPTPRAVAN
jgi:hypothetical protein